MTCSHGRSAPLIFVGEGTCAIAVYLVLPVGMNDEQGWGAILVLVFSGTLGVSLTLL